MCLNKRSPTGTVIFMIGFIPPKYRKGRYMNLETLEPWVSRIGKDHIITSRKRRKCVQKKLRTFEPWVLRLRKNRIFKPPKCRKWVRTKLRVHDSQKSHFQVVKIQKPGYRSPWNVFHETEKYCFQDTHLKWRGMCRSCLTLTFDLWTWPLIWSFRMGFELWTWIKTIGILTTTVFLKNFNMQKMSLIYYAHRNGNFHEPVLIGFYIAEIQKMTSHEARNPWTVGLTNRQRSHFQGRQNWRKCVHTKLRTLQPWVTRLGKNRSFKLPKCRKWPHEATNPWTVSFKTRQ